MLDKPWTGLLSANSRPFNEQDSIDEIGLRGYVTYPVSLDVIAGLVCNNHSGEEMSRRGAERVEMG